MEVFMNKNKLISNILKKINKLDLVIVCLGLLVIIVGMSPQL